MPMLQNQTIAVKMRTLMLLPQIATLYIVSNKEQVSGKDMTRTRGGELEGNRMQCQNMRKPVDRERAQIS